MSMNHKTWGFAKTGRNMDPSWFSLCTCISWPIADGNQAVPVLRIWEYEISVVSGLRTNLTYNCLIRINNLLALNRYCFGTLNWKIVALSVTHMNDRLVKRSWHKHVVQHFFHIFSPNRRHHALQWQMDYSWLWDPVMKSGLRQAEQNDVKRSELSSSWLQNYCWQFSTASTFIHH